MELGLDGRAVLVAGGGGLGGSCIRGFSAEGARVVVVDSDADRLRALDDELGLSTAGGGIVHQDLATAESCRTAVDKAVAQLGGLDVFVHAVGRNVRRPVLDADDDDWQRTLTLNLSTAWWLGRATGRLLCAAGRGRMVFLSSVSGRLAHPDHGAYAASKGGLNQLMRVMAAEWAPRGVTVNAVAPGYVPTPLTEEHLARPGVHEHLTSLVPFGRLGRAEEVVGPVLFLASDMASFVTGHVLTVDGGRTLV